MIPGLKDVMWERDGEDLVVVVGTSEHLVLGDPEGSAERLLALVREGRRTPEELAEELARTDPGVGADEVREALAALDELGILLDRAEKHDLTSREQERYFSNLAFFSMSANLDRGPFSQQQALRDAHVVVLGAGGLCSTVLLNLAGLGVGRLTVLDFDRVELKNFARQYLYREADIGRPKVERAAAWVRAFNSGIEVGAVERRIEGPEQVADLLPGADLVVSGVDHPARAIDEWVNDACVSSRVPYIRGGMTGWQVTYWSVVPGRTACRTCHYHEVDADLAADPDRRRVKALLSGQPRVNRGIGPVASLIGSLVSMEALRYLTGFAPPLSAGAMCTVDVRTGETESVPLRRWDACPVCESAR